MIKSKIVISILFIFVFLFSGCGEKSDSENNSDRDSTKSSQRTELSKPKVTFIELGSDKCIPCKMMQPVMKAIEEEFGDQIEIVFYDVWKDNAPAKKYGIKLIPTQIFLDEKGNEFFRHEGFFPREEIEKLLMDQGLKILNQEG